MYDYLNATKRRDIGDFSREYAHELREDKGAEYDELIEIDLNTLEPHINGPFTPDLATPISKFKEAVQANKWPEELKVGLIGSCTNSSYEDMTRAASIAQDAMDHGIKAKALFTVTPGSEQIRATIQRTYSEQIRRCSLDAFAAFRALRLHESYRAAWMSSHYPER
jgi:aconitate hydratase